jgi:DNA-binding XRE family transcriptional regulator
MRWTVETLDLVDDEITELPPRLQARLLRLFEMVENIGLDQLHEPHVKHLDGKLWELRAKAAEGIARGIYVTVTGRRVVACTGENETGVVMTKLADLKKKLMQNPAVQQEYAQANADYTLIEDLIRVRMEAKLTQSDLAMKIGTTQSAIARLEGGKISPSVSTLRRYAEATGHKLKVSFV